MYRLAQRVVANDVCSSYPSPLPIYVPDNSATTTFTCTDQQMIKATAKYNGNAPSTYLPAVAGRLDNIGYYFTGATSTDASTTDAINKLNAAGDDSVYAALHSPGELTIVDNKGDALGVVDGQVRNDFRFASYDANSKAAYIFFPKDDNLSFKVVGTGTGPYRLDISIATGGKLITFNSDNIETRPGQIDTFSIDRDAVLKQLSGVMRKADYDGNGTVDETQSLAATVTDLPAVTLKPLPAVTYIPIVLPNRRTIPDSIMLSPSPSIDQPIPDAAEQARRKAAAERYREALMKTVQASPTTQ
jgi:hypothetical protein